MSVVAGLVVAAAALLVGRDAVAQSADPQLRIELGTHGAPARSLAVSPARDLVVTASDDKTARVWRLSTGEPLQVLRPIAADGETGRLYAAALHPAAPWVAVAGVLGDAARANAILVFDVRTGSLIRTIDARGREIRRLAWSPDGTLLLAVDARDPALRAFDASGAMVHEQRFERPAYGLAVASDGTVAASEIGGTITLARAAGGAVVPLRALRAPGREPVGLAFSPDGARLAVGFFHRADDPVVVDVASGRTMHRLASPPRAAGNRMNVAWSADGASIVAAGTGYLDERQFVVDRYEATGGTLLGTVAVARNSVLDLVPLRGDAVAWASGDGGWGVLEGARIASRVAGAAEYPAAPDQLLLGSDASRVAWTRGDTSRPLLFDFAVRVVKPAAADRGLVAPVTRSGLFDGSTWQDTDVPRIDGRPIALDPQEVSRAIARLPDGGVVLGTTRALRRIDASGRVLWRVDAPSEVRAVNLRADGRVAVTALADGTLRWWRTSDGGAVLSLLAVPDGRWVAWLPTGHFDAGAGADGLVGWSVNRTDAPVADFFDLGRFRERMARPDVVDRVLRTLDPAAALAEADAALRAAAAAADPGPPAATPQDTAPIALADPVTSGPVFPPVLVVTVPEPTRIDEDTVRLSFAIRGRGDVTVEARADGRPVDARIEVGPAAPDGTLPAVARVALAPGAADVLQLIARDTAGVSMPITFRLPPAPPLVPEVDRVEAPSAPGVPEPLRVPDAPGPMPAPAEPTRPAPQAAVRPQGDPMRLPAPPRPTRRLFVLAVGVSEYQRAEYRLGLAAKDASDFVAAWERQRGLAYAEVHARTLTDARATRGEILAGLRWLTSSAGRDDVAVLFLAGHGVNSARGEYHFLPHEGRHERLAETGVPQAAIRNALRDIRGRALFFVDTCFAGNALGGSGLARLASDLAATENGVVVFASSSGKQESLENAAWGNGAFTKAVLDGLAGQADARRTGRVTVKGLDFFLAEEVERRTNGRQTPVTITPVAVPDFAIARVGG